MVVRLVFRLSLLKAIYSSVEAEVRLAMVLLGQAVDSQGPAEWRLNDHRHPRRQEEDRRPWAALPRLDGVGILPRKRC